MGIFFRLRYNGIIVNHIWRKEGENMSNNEEDVVIIDADENGFVVQPNNDERLMAMLIYLISIATSIIGPLIIWLIKREDSDFVDYHGKEYFNMVISYFIYGVIAFILSFILIGFVLYPILAIALLIFTIIAAVKAYQGERYQIPFIFRFIK